MILKHNGIVSKAAHELGINPREIYALAEKYPPMSRRHHDREEE